MATVHIRGAEIPEYGDRISFGEVIIIQHHGRLIDADALLALCPELKEYLETMAPTVIPEDR